MGYWLKLYTDILDDPKYFKLSKEARLGMYELLLVAKKIENGTLTGQLPCVEDIAFYTRRPVEEWQAVLPELVSIGVITDGDNPIITNYSKRQEAISNKERYKQYKKKRNANAMQRDATESVGETDKETDKKQNTETEVEKEKKSFSPRNFIGEFVDAVRVQFTNGDQPETIKDLVQDYGEDVVLQAATWYGQNKPRNMGHALKSIETALSRGWRNKESKHDNEKVLEEWLNGDKGISDETDPKVMQTSSAVQTNP